MITKSSSILDYSYPFLDPAVWGQDMQLYSYQKDFILRLLDKMYETYSLKDHEKWVEDVVILGSLTTTKWLLSSDLDVHVRVNLDEFLKTNMPNASKEEAFAKLDETRKEFDRAKILAPMTQHPTEFYIESLELHPSNTEAVGVYSLYQNKWLKDPIALPAELDIEESKRKVVEEAEALAQELDGSLGKVKRDIQRVDELENVIKAWGKDKQKLFYTKIEKKLTDIEEEIKKDLKIKQDLVDYRHSNQDPTSENEILFKYLARNGFFAILQNLKELLEATDGEVTVDELPLIEKVISRTNLNNNLKLSMQKFAAFMKKANVKEDIKQADNEIYVDVDDTLFHETPDFKIGEPIEGAKEGLLKLKELGYIIVLDSHRCNTEEGCKDVKEAMKKYNMPYDKIYDGNKPLAKYYIDDRAIHFDSWNNVLKQIGKSEKKAYLRITTTFDLPVIDPKIFDRKEPYALFIGTQDYGNGVKVDLFDVFGQHPMITPSNQMPTVTLEKLQQENIPIIGKEPRAETKQPVQDISSLYKQARIFSKKEIKAQTKKVKQGDYSCLMALVPHDLAQEIVEFGVRTIPDDKIYLDEDGNLGRELESHITIKYGLLTNDAKHVRRSFNNEKPFKAKLGKVKHFQPPELPFDVLTVEVISDDLDKANKKVCDNFECAEGLVSDEYHPHITIAYMKRDTAKEYIGSDVFEGKELELDTLVFSPHKGNRTYFSISSDKESRFVLEKINKISMLNDNYWISPDGKEWPTEGNTHMVWMENNPNILSQYGLNIKDFEEALYVGGEDLQEAAGKIWDEMFSKGWIRVTGDMEGGSNYGITLMNLKKVPSYLDTFLAKHNPNGSLYVEDFNGQPVQIDDPFPSLQKAINRSLSHKRLQPVSELNKSAGTSHNVWIDPNGKIYALEGNTHNEWISSNLKFLQSKYNLPVEQYHYNQSREYFDALNEGIENVETPDIGDIWEEMIHQGWVRLGDPGGKQSIGIELKDIHTIPSFVDSYISKFLTSGATIYVEDLSRNIVEVTYPFKSLQQAVNRALASPTKTASGNNFYPSLVQAPNNNWTPDSDLEIPVDPDPISDEETFYAPCTVGKPRPRTMWEQVWHMLKKPFSKKEAKGEVVEIGKVRGKSIQVPEDLLTKYINIIRSFDTSKVDVYKLDLERRNIHEQLVEFVLQNFPEEIASLPKVGLVNLRNQIAGMLADIVEELINLRKEKEGSQKQSAADIEQEQIEKKELGENETLLEYSKSFKDLNRLNTNKPKTTWQDNSSSQGGEPYAPLPSFHVETNPQNQNWRYPWKFTRRPVGEDSDQGKTIEMLEEQEKRKACIERLTRDITAGTYSASVPDYQGYEWGNEQRMNNGDEVNYINKDHVDNGYGFRDFNDSSTDYPKPEDISPAVVHLDILQKPFNRTDPAGIDWYQVQWYISAPMSQGIESVNPD